MDTNKLALEILADAVDRTVGFGIVHAAVTKAAETMHADDHSRAGQAFRLLEPEEFRSIRTLALAAASGLVQSGELATLKGHDINDADSIFAQSFNELRAPDGTEDSTRH